MHAIRFSRLLCASLFACLACFGCCCVRANAQQGSILSDETPAPTIIPFELTHANNILIDVTLNGADAAKLMLHTGVNSVSVTRETAKKLKTLVFDKTADVSSWGGEQEARLSTKNTLRIGELKWDDIEITERALSGPGSDGKFGLNLFADRVIEIDFDARQLKLYDSLPPHLVESEPLELTHKAGGLFVRGELVVGESVIEQEFLIHSGYSGTLLLDDAFIAEHQTLGELPIISENELKDSYGNIIKTRTVQLARFKLGQIEFDDVPAGYFAGTVGRQRMSVLGGDILRRCVITFDAERKYVYLRPGKAAADEFFD